MDFGKRACTKKVGRDGRPSAGCDTQSDHHLQGISTASWYLAKLERNKIKRNEMKQNGKQHFLRIVRTGRNSLKPNGIGNVFLTCIVYTCSYMYMQVSVKVHVANHQVCRYMYMYMYIHISPFNTGLLTDGYMAQP